MTTDQKVRVRVLRAHKIVKVPSFGEKGSWAPMRRLGVHIHPRFEITVVQPGLSASKVSDAQLQLLACAEVYVHETASVSPMVYCSA